MKELYIAPELEVLCFAPVENLASGNVVDFGDLLRGPGDGSYLPGTEKDSGDVLIPIN